ncbi:MAG: GLPGLI family protein, partial [Bacteroidales bacterium]
IANCELLVTYKFDYLENPENDNRYNEPMLLEISDDIVKFYSQNSFLRDSLINDFYHKNRNNPTVGINAESWLPNNQSILYMDIYTNPKQLNREIYHRFDLYDYMYSESTDKIIWQVTGEEKSVLGYSCRRAEAEYKGRKWIVWFSIDIPYNFGPWKLSGLPGLILSAADSDGLFSWTAIGISKPQGRNIYKFNPEVKNTKKWAMLPQYVVRNVNKKDIDNLWMRQWLSPASMHFVFRGMTKGIIKTRLPDGSVRSIAIDLNSDVGYYPRIELK